jgi:arginase
MSEAPHEPERPAVTLLGVPYDASSSFQRGPAEAPPLIREALHSSSSNMWTEDGTDLGAEGILADAGDVALTNPDERSARTRGEIEVAVATLLECGDRPLVLGGDHSITCPVLRAFHRVYPRLSILHVDAHPDLYDEFEGDRYSHACPFARIMEEGLAARLVQVGIRTLNGHQAEQARRFGVEVIEMRALAELPALSFDTPLYVSFDLDALDPAFAPGVSHREPGGLSVRQAIALIHGIAVPLVGADVVEYNPRNDPAGITAPVAAKLVKELAARMLHSPARVG